MSPEELDALLEVPTTVEEAQRILVRNTNLLNAVLASSLYVGYVGCPHCSYAIASGDPPETFGLQRMRLD